MRSNGITIHLIEMKPAVGFTLPSAGVTPAPGEGKKKAKREMARTPFRSQVPLWERTFSV
jgi:hypothetical protein